MELTPHPDWDLITDLGGPAKVAELLDYPKDGGVQRVQNWKHRGIPPAVKLERPDLFLPDMQKKRKVAVQPADWDGTERRKAAKAKAA